MHTRVDNRVSQVVKRIQAGNIYVNRNQIGAVVGSQPFGGEGMSGTGPKAGGPQYVQRFKAPQQTPVSLDNQTGRMIGIDELQLAVNSLKQSQTSSAEGLSPEMLGVLADACQQQSEDFETDLQMPGPTGELNMLSNHARGVIVCTGPDLAAARQQIFLSLAQGNGVVLVCPQATQLAQALPEQLAIVAIDGQLAADALSRCEGIAALASFADTAVLKEYRQALASRKGALLPLLTETESERYIIERHLCVDTTAAGGNASLIAQVE